jgi:hypothetical protein
MQNKGIDVEGVGDVSLPVLISAHGHNDSPRVNRVNPQFVFFAAAPAGPASHLLAFFSYFCTIFTQTIAVHNVK